MNRSPSLFLQHAALAPDALGDEQAAHARRPDHAGRVELDHLHVHQFRARVVGHHDAVARGLPGVGRDLVHAPPAAGGEDDRLGLEDDEAARLAGVAERADHPLAVFEQSGQRHFHVDVHAHADGLVLHGADEFQPRPVADVVEATVGVAAERALGDQPLRRPVEDRAVLFQFQDALRGLLGEDLHGARVVEERAALHGVHEVDLPVVRLAHVAQGGRHAALGHDRVRLAQQGLADHADAAPRLARRHGRPQPRAARADDQYVGLKCFVRSHNVLKILPTEEAPPPQ